MNKPSERERARRLWEELSQFDYDPVGKCAIIPCEDSTNYWKKLDLITAALIQAKVEGERVGLERAAKVCERESEVWREPGPNWPKCALLDAARHIRSLLQETGEGEG